MHRCCEACLLALIAILLFLPLHLRGDDDLRTSCAAKSSAADTIQCLTQGPPAPPGKAGVPKKEPPIPDGCAALSRWLDLLASGNAPKDAEQKITANLKTACDQQKNFQLANYLLAQQRFADAIAYFNKIGDPALLPEVTERTRHGLRTAAILQNSLVMPPRKVQDLERQGKFGEAYQALALAAPETDPHRKNLAALLQLERNGISLEHRHEYQPELAAYQSYLQGLDRVRDEYLYAAADAKVGALEPAARKQADDDARAQLQAADLQMKHGAYSDAVTTLSQVTAKTGISPDLTDEATGKLAQARVKAANEPTWLGAFLSFFWSLPKALVSLLNWFAYAVLIVAAFVVIWIASLVWVGLHRPQKSILLSMTDRTSTAGAQADQTLSEQIRRQMDLPLPDRELRIDAANEMDGSSLGQVSLRIPFRAAETVFQSNTAVSFGPFSINPFAIASQIQGWFALRHKLEIEGELYALGSNTVCSAKLTFGKLDEKGPWEGLATGDTARDQAIRDAAMKILIAIDSEARKITQNPRSLSQLRLGMDFQNRALDDPDHATALWTQARNSFQQSALEDPGNWLARFNLGTAMRKLGLNALAAEQFEELQNGPHLPAEHRAVVAYNRAAALQKTDDKDIAQTVIKMMDSILAMPDLHPSLQFLASSGRLATIAARYYRMWRRQQRIGAKQKADQVQKLTHARAEGLALLTAIENAIAGGTEVAGSELNVVMAVTLNALGQLEALLDTPDSARLHYRRALTFLPSFVEANLNLAELYLEKKGSLDTNWSARAERLLLDAQNVDANNTRSEVLLGTLYANPVFGRIDDAIKQLTKALPDPNAGQRLAGIYYEEGKPADAIAPLLSALAQDTSLGSGHLLLARCALALDPSDRRRCELVRRAESWLKKLAKGKGGSQYQKDAESLLPKVSAALAECAGKKPAPPARQPSFGPPSPPTTSPAHAPAPPIAAAPSAPPALGAKPLQAGTNRTSATPPEESPQQPAVAEGPEAPRDQDAQSHD